jgi:hypothetical protein
MGQERKWKEGVRSEDTLDGNDGIEGVKTEGRKKERG